MERLKAPAWPTNSTPVSWHYPAVCRGCLHLVHGLWVLRTSLQWHDKWGKSSELWCPEGFPLQMAIDGGWWYDMMAAIALYDGDDETWCLGGWQERWRREVRLAVGESIYMEDPYLSNLLMAKPARQHPQYLESRAKAYLCPSLTLYSLAAFQKLTGWLKWWGRRNRDECHQGWLALGWSATEQEILKDGGSWCRSKKR